MNATTCPRCGGATDGRAWCDACRQRTTPAPEYRIEKRSTSRRPRRWMVRRRWLHTTAALMSLAVPGAGQVYKGRVAVGVAWFAIVAAAYAWVGIPGFLVHLMCIITAGSAARVVRRPFLYDGVSWSKR